ncbi:hypothetical protein D3C85_775500 [compost metagenome]
MSFSLNAAALVAVLCLAVAAGRGCIRADIVRIDYGTCRLVTAGAETNKQTGAIAIAGVCTKGRP